MAPQPENRTLIRCADTFGTTKTSRRAKTCVQRAGAFPNGQRRLSTYVLFRLVCLDGKLIIFARRTDGQADERDEVPHHGRHAFLSSPVKAHRCGCGCNSIITCQRISYHCTYHHPATRTCIHLNTLLYALRRESLHLCACVLRACCTTPVLTKDQVCSSVSFCSGCLIWLCRRSHIASMFSRFVTAAACATLLL